MVKILLVVFLFSSLSLQAQSTIDNRNFFKLYIQNDKKEIMLIKYQGAWEIPGSSFSANTTIADFLDSMALKHGIAVTGKQLAAQITFHHEIRERPTIMLYYKARYKSGTLKTPAWGEEVRWVPLTDAYSLIPYPEMVAIMKKINTKKHTVWGGALKITYDKNTKARTGYEIIEDFYILN